MLRYLFVVVFYCSSALMAQSLTGLTGLLNAPSADMQEDGTFYMGLNYLNRNFIEFDGGDSFHYMAYYFDLTYLPFLEVNFRSTTRPTSIEGKWNVDRMFSVRLQVFKERRFVPSIVLGGHDLYTTVTDKTRNQYFGALYIVSTKHFKLLESDIGITLGYGFNAFRKQQFLGIFGGVSYNPDFFHQLKLMAEYDSKEINIGASLLFFNHLNILIVLQGLKAISGGIAYKIYLKKKK